MSLFEKMKKWFTSDEKREKKILEKEKKEREKRREKGEEVKGKEEKKKKKVVMVKKAKQVDVDNNPYLKKNQDKHDEVKEDEKVEKEVEQVQDVWSVVENVEEEKVETNKKIEEVEDIKEEVKEHKEEKEFNWIENEVEDDYFQRLLKEREEEKKKELVRKKLEEKEKYTEMMMELPPSANIDEIIKRALEIGIPEWYLREEGYIVDDEEVVEDVTQGKEDIQPEVEKESVSNEVEVNVQEEVKSDSKGDVEDKEEEHRQEDLLEYVEVIIENNEENEEEKDSEEVKAENEENRVVEEVVKEEEKKVEENVSSSEVTSETNRNLLMERLKTIAEKRVKREVLKVDGDTVFVKEEKEDADGNKKASYVNYKVMEEEAKEIKVGEELKEDIVVEKVKPKVVIDGEEYTISEEEEEKIINEIDKKEVWIVCSDKGIIEKVKNQLEGSKYLVYVVENDKDFIKATRKIQNVIVITQHIPQEVKKSIASYLKYLEEEKKKARLVTLADSLVRAEVIEYVFKELNEAELDHYYEEFDSSRYSKSKKPLLEILKVISFDITDTLGQEVEVDVGVVDNKDLLEVNLDLRGYYEVDVANEKKREDISLDDTLELEVQIETDELKIVGDVEIEMEGDK